MKDAKLPPKTERLADGHDLHGCGEFVLLPGGVRDPWSNSEELKESETSLNNVNTLLHSVSAPADGSSDYYSNGI